MEGDCVEIAVLMFKKNFKWLRHAVVCALVGLMPCAFAQQKKSSPPATPGKKKEKSGTAVTDKAPSQTPPAAKPSATVPDATVKAQISDDPTTPTMSKRTSFDLKPDQEAVGSSCPSPLPSWPIVSDSTLLPSAISNVELGLRNPKDEELTRSSAVTFAKELGMQFYYTGGVRIVKPVIGEVRRTPRRRFRSSDRRSPCGCWRAAIK